MSTYRIVANDRVTQMLRKGDAQVFKKYSQMKLQMKREALDKINRRANEMSGVSTVPTENSVQPMADVISPNESKTQIACGPEQLERST